MARPMSAVVLGQVRQWAQQQAPAVAAPSDPLADRSARLPNGKDGRFRMREPMSVARVVDSVGTLFYPPGEGPDPCPRNREHIAGLASEGNSRALQQELEFERRHCRP